MGGMRALAESQFGVQPPPLSAEGLRRLAGAAGDDLYDPEDSVNSADEEGLVIDDQEKDEPEGDEMDVENSMQNIPLPPGGDDEVDSLDSSAKVDNIDDLDKPPPAVQTGKAHRIKIHFNTSRDTLGQKKEVEQEKKKSLAAEIFQKEDEDNEEDLEEVEKTTVPAVVKTNEEILKEMRLKSSQKLSLVTDIFGEEKNENGNSDQETFKIISRGSRKPENPPKKSLMADIFGSDDEADVKETVEIAEEEYSDVSDGPGEEMSEAREVKEDNEQQEGGEIREVRLREPSVSPIESDQSESYEKAGTLEGLNPETISPEEDFTSLSEEEEGEIKNYEKKKALKKKKKELQRKVRELERKVIEISPNR